MARILITGAGGPAGRALANQLAGRYLIGADFADISGSPAAARFAELHRGPAAADLAFVPFLRRLVERTRAELVIPTVQDELPFVAGAARLLGAPVVTAPAEGVALAHDKLLTAMALADAGVPVPDTAAAEDLLAGVALPFPIVVKPRVSRGGRGVLVLDDAAAYASWLSEQASAPVGGLIAQAFAPGEEFAVQLHNEPGAAPDVVVVLRKTALKQGRVGNAAGVERCGPHEHPDVATVAVRAVAALGLSGPTDVDVRRLADGRPVVLEVNARFGANSEYAPELLDRVLARHLGRKPVVVA